MRPPTARSLPRSAGPARGRRAAATVAGLLAAVVVGLGWSQAVALPSAPPDSDQVVGAARAAPGGSVRLDLLRLGPVSAGPDRPLRLAGAVSTPRRGALRGVTVQLEVGTAPLQTRTALTTLDTAPPFTTPVPGGQAQVGRIGPSTQRSFRITVPGVDLPLGATGVYPLRLVVSSEVDGTPVEVASLTTFLTWAPVGTGVEPTRALWVWPLVSQPARDLASRRPSNPLVAEISAGGRLDGLVDAAVDRAVTWVVDPALLADVAAVSRGEAGTAAAEARRWLTTLATATAGRDVVALPYADPDVAALLDADHPELLRAARGYGLAVAGALLPGPVRGDLAWPADGVADADTLTQLGRLGTGAVLLDGATMPLVTPLPWTPSGRVSFGDRPVEVLLADPASTAVLTDPATTPSAILLARQRYLAETLLVTAELPSASRLLVLAPPRRWSPDAAYADTLLAATAQATWLQPVSLDQALTVESPLVERAGPLVPEESQARQIPPGVVNRAAGARDELGPLQGILTRPARVVPPYRQTLHSSVSTAWREDHPRARGLSRSVASGLAEELGKARIVSRGGTLTSDRGTLPLTIVNDFDQPIRVGLDVRSTDPLRLKVAGPGVVRVQARGNTSLEVEVEAVVSGNLQALAQLTTPAGQPFGEPVELDVQVRAYGAVALIVFGMAAALLFLAAAVRVWRRIRRRPVATEVSR